MPVNFMYLSLDVRLVLSFAIIIIIKWWFLPGISKSPKFYRVIQSIQGDFNFAGVWMVLILPLIYFAANNIFIW